MKTKTEILKKINEARELRDGYKFAKNKEFNSLCNIYIKALKWTLGYKTKIGYWCTKCHTMHNGMQCPKCGSANVLDAQVKEVKG